MPRLPSKLLLQNHIQQRRTRMGVTQQDLADAVGVTRATVVALEKGSYNPSLELAFRLARFFDTKIEILFTAKGEGK